MKWEVTSVFIFNARRYLTEGNPELYDAGRVTGDSRSTVLQGVSLVVSLEVARLSGKCSFLYFEILGYQTEQNSLRLRVCTLRFNHHFFLAMAAIIQIG